MAHPPLVSCLFCHRPLKLGELAVFREEAKVAHVRCWRPSRHADSGAPPNPLAPEPDVSKLTATPRS